MPRSHPARIFAGLLLILLAVAPPLNFSSDGGSMLAVAESLVGHGTIAVSCATGIPGREGACYSNFYPLLSVLLVPFVVAGHLLGSAIGGSAVYLGRAAAIQPAGNAWGTRYLVPLMPLLCVGLTSLRGRAAKLGIVLAVAVAVSQIPTTVGYFESGYHDAGAQSPGAWDLHRLQLIDVWAATVREVERAAHTDPGALVRSAGTGAHPDNRLLSTVALWWWMLPAVGVPAVLGALIASLAIALGACLILRAPRARAP